MPYYIPNIHVFCEMIEYLLDVQDRGRQAELSSDAQSTLKLIGEYQEECDYNIKNIAIDLRRLLKSWLHHLHPDMDRYYTSDDIRYKANQYNEYLQKREKSPK